MTICEEWLREEAAKINIDKTILDKKIEHINKHDLMTEVVETSKKYIKSGIVFDDAVGKALVDWDIVC